MEKYYVSGCIELEGTVSHVEDDTAEFFTLYEKKENGQSHALLDCVDRLSVEAAMAVYVEHAALQEQVLALAAEAEALKNYIKSECFIMEVGAHPMAEADISAGERMPETPATADAIREIRAQAVDAAIDAMVRSGAQSFGDCVVAVNSIRAGDKS